MNKSIILYVLMCFQIFAVAQSKYNNNWVLGHENYKPQSKEGGILINFNFSPPKVEYLKIPFGFGPVTSMSDKDGNLLFFSGGCSIANKEFKIMKNGNDINAGVYHKNYCLDSSYPMEEGLLILPDNVKKDNYSLLHLKVNDNSKYISFLQTKIDMTLENGLGAVISKNQSIYPDSFYAQRLTAVRNANGRDWWITVPVDYKNEYHTFYYGQQGIKKEPLKQSIGPAWNAYQIGQSCFSPRGNKYAKCDTYNGLLVMDFDRCTGQFSNPVSTIVNKDTLFSGGVAFSPNGKYMYYADGYKVYQFDCAASGFLKSMEVVAVFDGYIDIFQTIFYQMRLASDGKIYICSGGSNTVLHTIHSPNSKGLACDLRQHDFQMPATHWNQMPNFPYYDLYAMKGSPCDTLGINDPTSIEETEKLVPHKIYPNPTTGFLNIEVSTSDFRTTKILIFNTLGEIILKENITQAQQQLDLYHLANGTYFYNLQIDGKVAGRGKVVKIE